MSCCLVLDLQYACIWHGMSAGAAVQGHECRTASCMLLGDTQHQSRCPHIWLLRPGLLQLCWEGACHTTCFMIYQCQDLVHVACAHGNHNYCGRKYGWWAPRHCLAGNRAYAALVSLPVFPDRKLCFVYGFTYYKECETWSFTITCSCRSAVHSIHTCILPDPMPSADGTPMQPHMDAPAA
jgi:hypothetical protein